MHVRPAGRLRLWLARATLLFCALLLVDAVAGLVLLPRQEGRADSYYHHGLKPGICLASQWGAESYKYCTNSLGMRDSTSRVVPERSPEPRLVLIGDSFTEGVGLPYERTFAGLLAERLRPSGYEVLNAGVKSYSPKLYELRVRHLLEVEKVEFQALIILPDVSDPQDEIVYRPFQPGRHAIARRVDGVLRQHLYGYRLVREHWPAWSRVLQGSFRADDVATTPGFDTLGPQATFYQERDRWVLDASVQARWGDEGWRRTVESTARLVALARSRGITVAIAIYPWASMIREPLGGAVYLDRWRSAAAGMDVPLVDVVSPFTPSADPDVTVGNYYIPGDVHMSAAGHVLIAETLAPAAKRLLELPDAHQAGLQ